jgi:succinate-semialdehyde dehydrogenase / glutarate-semialdehyde dehydrogenase
VFDCANVDAAVEGLIASKFRNAGQTCICSNRIFVQKKVYLEFVSKLCEKVAKMPIGRALDNQTEIGSLIHERAVKRVEDLVSEALQSSGASLLLGGKRDVSLSGSFFMPTVLADVQDRCQVFQTEIFGPVAAVSQFESEEEVITRANNTRVGLASYLYANNVGRIMRVSRALETGMVGVNTGVISTEVAPFGGVKESGHGREGSKYGFDDYTNLKYVALQY